MMCHNSIIKYNKVLNILAIQSLNQTLHENKKSSKAVHESRAHVCSAVSYDRARI